MFDFQNIEAYNLENSQLPRSISMPIIKAIHTGTSDCLQNKKQLQRIIIKTQSGRKSNASSSNSAPSHGFSSIEEDSCQGDLEDQAPSSQQLNPTINNINLNKAEQVPPKTCSFLLRTAEQATQIPVKRKRSSTSVSSNKIGLNCNSPSKPFSDPRGFKSL